ncbi:MAG: type IV secretion system DNA-binding domain-containing protein [Planctomycetales bacterium]|nr:type IV secretion system DNA-binding domain-containing protein [Planctomycetales bacterium]
MNPTTIRGLSQAQQSVDEWVYVVATFVLPSAVSFAAMHILAVFAGDESAAAVTMLFRTALHIFSIVKFDRDINQWMNDHGALPTISVAALAIFWSMAYEAVARFRFELALPRWIDISLYSKRRYLLFLLRTIVINLKIAMCLLAVAVIAPGLAWYSTLLVSVFVWIRTEQRESKYQSLGKPRFALGTYGVRLKPVSLLREVYGQRTRSELRVGWGGIDLDISHLIKNFLIVGSVGSGKTIIFRRWLQDLMPRIAEFKDWRAIIVDPKSELYGFLLRLLPSYKVKLMSPGDGRSFVWRISEDIREPKHIRELCYILIPDDGQESQPYFRDGARRLLYGVILAFTLLGDRWRFSDIFFAVRSSTRLSAILSLFPESADILGTYSKNPKAFADVHSTLDTKVAVYLSVAEAWSHIENDHPTRTVSLTEWCSGNFALLVSTQASAGESHERLIAAIVKRATQLILDGPTKQSIGKAKDLRRTIIAVDEGPRAGKLELVTAATSLRDYGGVLCYVFQSREAMSKWFPKQDELDAIVNEFHTLAFLRTNSPATAEWMSRRIGKFEEVRSKLNQSGQVVGNERNWQVSIEPTEFMTLGQGKTISPDFVPGIFANSELGTWYCDEPVDLTQDVRVPHTVDAPKGSLRPWNDDDLERLGLTAIRDELDLEGGHAPAPPRPKTRPPEPKTTHKKFRP